MNDESVINDYIDAAVRYSKANAEGDFNGASKATVELNKIFYRIRLGKNDISVLLDCIDSDVICVRVWAASHLLGLGVEPEKAEQTLEDIVGMKDDSGEYSLDIFTARTTLQMWKRQGYLSF